MWTGFLSQHNFENTNDPSLVSWLRKRGWDRIDLCFHLLRPSALQSFKEQRYAPGLESFSVKRNALDTVIYSLLRVKNAGLARELWISLSEGEVTFAELASLQRWARGSDQGCDRSSTAGSIEPALRSASALESGAVAATGSLGDWYVFCVLRHLNRHDLISPLARG